MLKNILKYKKKIAFIGTKGINYGDNSFGGFETVVTELAPRLEKNGYYITIYCRKKLYKTKIYPNELNGVKLKFYTGIESKNLGTITQSFLAIINAIKEKNQIIFLFNIGLGIFIPLLKFFKIYTITNLDGVEWERSKWSQLAKYTFRLGAYFNVKFADLIISDAEAIRKLYQKKYDRDSTVIPYGAEIRNDLNSDKIINEFGLKVNGYYLLATRFVPENNPLFIIKNYIKSSSTKPLVVLGSNYYKSNYEKEIKKLKDPRILFLGHISDRKLLLEFYRYSYVYIHAHSVGGTNPTMLEALANSCCILALDTIFNREMLDDGEFGIFFTLDKNDYVNKINYLENNGKVIQTFKQKSSKRIINYYNWESVTNKYIDLLNNI